MAESLGAAVLTVSVEDAQLKAGLRAAEQQAAATGRSLEQAFNKTGRPLQTASNGLQFFIDAQGRARDASGKLLTIAQQQAAGLDRLGSAAQGAGTSVGGLGQNLTAFAQKAAAAVAILETIRQVSLFTASQITELDSASAAVRTLGVDSDDLTRRLRALSVEFNNSISTVDLTKAAYDVASSGFSEAADATQILRAATLGAKGGFAEVNDVASALTGVLNAYGLSASEATKIVDGFVQTQADGVITVRQYASEIGNIASIAAASGVGIDELNAAIATATLRGVPVSQTFTGLRQALASIIKPSEQAKELAAALGIEFSVGALQAKGLGGVLADVQQKTGGAAGAIAVLLGSVEAQAAVQPLLNDNLVKYNELLERQADAAGEAAAASEINAQTISEGITQIGNGFSNLATTLDTVLSPLFAGFIKDINSILVKLNQVAALSPDKVLTRERQATDAVAGQLFPGQGSGFFGPVTIDFNGKTYKGSAAGVREAIIQDLLRQDLAAINTSSSKGAATGGQVNQPANAGPLGKPGPQNSQKTGVDPELIKEQEEAAKSVTNAFDKVAKSSDALADAQQGLLSTLGGSFDILTDKQQQKVFDANVADIKRAIKAGFFDGDKIGTLKGKEVIGVGDQARAVLRASENLENAQNDLVKSNQDLTKATATLAEKKWEVNVAVNANTGESSVDLG